MAYTGRGRRVAATKAWDGWRAGFPHPADCDAADPQSLTAHCPLPASPSRPSETQSNPCGFATPPYPGPCLPPSDGSSKMPPSYRRPSPSSAALQLLSRRTACVSFMAELPSQASARPHRYTEDPPAPLQCTLIASRLSTLQMDMAITSQEPSQMVRLIAGASCTPAVPSRQCIMPERVVRQLPYPQFHLYPCIPSIVSCWTDALHIAVALLFTYMSHYKFNPDTMTTQTPALYCH